MAEKTVQSISPVAGLDAAGSVLTYSAASVADSFKNSGSVRYRVRNGAGAPVTVTFLNQGIDDFGVGSTTLNATAAVANGVEKEFGPFPTKRFNDANGLVQVTLTDAGSITVAAVNGA